MERAVLLVEDDPDDRELQQFLFSQAAPELRLGLAEDGEQAVAALRDGEPPRLVLLDLKLPRKTGFEVLEWIRAQPRLKDLPVFILSSSQEPKDIDRAYALGANSYLVKDVDIARMLKLAKGIAAFVELTAACSTR